MLSFEREEKTKKSFKAFHFGIFTVLIASMINILLMDRIVGIYISALFSAFLGLITGIILYRYLINVKKTQGNSNDNEKKQIKHPSNQIIPKVLRYSLMLQGLIIMLILGIIFPRSFSFFSITLFIFAVTNIIIILKAETYFYYLVLSKLT